MQQVLFCYLQSKLIRCFRLVIIKFRPIDELLAAENAVDLVVSSTEEVCNVTLCVLIQIVIASMVHTLNTPQNVKCIFATFAHIARYFQYMFRISHDTLQQLYVAVRVQ